MTTTMIAPTPGIEIAVQSGRRYVADDNGLIFGVDNNDVQSLATAGCVPRVPDFSHHPKTLDVTIYSLMDEDDGRVLAFTSTTEVTLIVPFGLPEGFRCDFVQLSSAGDVLWSADVGVTVYSSQGFISTASQYSTMSLIGIAPDVYVVTGDGTA